MAVADEARLQGRIEELEKIVSRQSKKLAKRDADWEAAERSLYRGAYEAMMAIGPPKQIPRPPRDRRKDPLHALLHWTDWHIGKVTPTFDSDVARTRVELSVHKTVRLTEIERADHPVRVLHVLIGGDMVEAVADIFPGQQWEVEAGGGFDQSFRCAGILSNALVTLSADFEEIFVYWVAGNHGRVGRRGQFPKGDNLDRLVIMFAKLMTQGLERMTWNDPDPHASFYQIVQAGNYRAALLHGHQIPKTSAAILRKLHQYKIVLPPWRDAFWGHVHSEYTWQLADGGVGFVTPSIESTNAHAQEVIAALGVPAQRLHFVHPEKGRRASEQLLFLA